MKMNEREDWISEDGRFQFGKHEGEMIDTVARDDPDYLEWIIENAEDISEEDRRCIEVSLRLKR